MTREDIEPFIGSRVAVYTRMGPIHVGYLQRAQRSTYQYETMSSPSHPEVESHLEPFEPGSVERIEPLTDEEERRLRAACTCSKERPEDWVFCPIHGPKGEEFPNHL
jgi:hypothetical protein